MHNRDSQHDREDTVYVVWGGDFPEEAHILGVFNNKGVACRFVRMILERHSYYVHVDRAVMNEKFGARTVTTAYRSRTKDGTTEFVFNEEDNGYDRRHSGCRLRGRILVGRPTETTSEWDTGRCLDSGIEVSHFLACFRYLCRERRNRSSERRNCASGADEF